MHVWTLWLWCEHTARTFVPSCNIIYHIIRIRWINWILGPISLLAYPSFFATPWWSWGVQSIQSDMAKEMNCEDLWGKWLRPPSQEPPGKWPHPLPGKESVYGTHCVQIMKLVVISNSNFFRNSKTISKSKFDHFCLNYHSRFPCWMHHVWPIILSDVSWPRTARSLPAWLNILIGAGHAWSQGKKHGSNKMLQVQRQPKLTRKSLKV